MEEISSDIIERNLSEIASTQYSEVEAKKLDVEVSSCQSIYIIVDLF